MSSFDLRHIAHLARLHFKDEELKVFESQITNILGFVDELKSVPVEGVEPTSHPVPISDVFRADEPKPGVSIEEFLKTAPRSRGRFFEVPKIIEDK